MAIKTKRCLTPSLASLLTLLLSLGIAASAQTMQPAPAPTPNQPAANPPAQEPNQPAAAPSRDDITSREVAEMDRFLDSHPEIAQLRKDPSLIDNRKWVGDHPALHEYLEKHPGVADAFRDHPDAFMRDENRYERAEGDRDQDRDRDRDRNISRRDVTEMGRFLDRHPEVSEQLRKDPSLIDNRQWVANHPALQEYLKTHPQVAETFRAPGRLHAG